MKFSRATSLFLFTAFIFSFQIYSQNADSAKIEEKVTAIMLTDIPMELERESSLLAEEETQLAESKNIEEATQQFEKLSAKYQELKSGSEITKLEQQTSGTIKELLRKWQTFQSDISQSLNDITFRTSSLQIQKNENKKALETWEVTKSTAVGQDIPSDLVAAIKNLQKKLIYVDQLIINELNSLLLIQTDLSKIGIEIDNTIQLLKEIDDANRRNILTRNAPPIWKLTSDTSDTKSLSQEFEDIVTGYQTGFSESFERYEEEIPIAIVLFFVFFIFILYLKNNSKGVKADDRILENSLKLLNYPLSATALIFGVFLTLSYSEALPSIQSVIKIVLLIPLIRIVVKMVNPSLIKLIYGFSILFFVNQIKIAASSATSLERLLLFILSALSIAGASWWIKKKHVSEHLYTEKQMEYMNIARKIMLLLLIFSLIANIFGFVKLGLVLLNGIFDTLFFTLILISGAYILRAILLVFLQTKFGLKFHVIKYKAHNIKLTTEKIISITLKIAWAVITLSAFNIYVPIKDWFIEFLGDNIGFGDFSITLGEILIFIATIWASTLISKFIRFILDEDILPRLNLPRGVPGTISILTKYFILGFGFIIAVSSVGLDLNKFTILIGALGVGIGFGLQDLVNNFISGLILIFERPIQIGDVVHFNQIEGKVTNIGIRSSTIRTWQGSEIIVPNGHLVSNDVTNWTLSDERRRIELAVGVEYGSDVELVKELLLSCVISDKRILDEPEPAVIFRDFGESSLNFELRCWAKNFDEWFTINSDLRFAVNKIFKENNITIPFPQRDLHIKSPDAKQFLNQKNSETETGKEKL